MASMLDGVMGLVHLCPQELMGALRKLPDIPGGLKGQAVRRQQSLK